MVDGANKMSSTPLFLKKKIKAKGFLTQKPNFKPICFYPKKKPTKHYKILLNKSMTSKNQLKTQNKKKIFLDLYIYFLGIFKV
jgi:hypothetical protein